MRNKNPIIYLPENFSKIIENSSKVTIAAGSFMCKAQVSKSLKGPQLSSQHISLNRAAAKELGLPGTRYLNYLNDGNTMYIGPVVAVMTTVIKNDNPPRGKGGRLFKELIDYAGERGVFVYLFNPGKISRRRNNIHGLTYLKGEWKWGLFPWPDIIYNRIRFRKIEGSKRMIKLINQLSNDERTYFFNSRFLNKREVYEALMTNNETSFMLPETRMFSRSNLKDLLSKHSELFAKPIGGSIGRGIFKIKTLAPNRYSLAQASSYAPSWKGPYSFNMLYQHLVNRYVSPNNYLLQQAINLAVYKSRVFDLRGQVQKNNEGKWILTGVAVRVAGKNRFVTHIPNGGRAAVFTDVINNVFPDQEIRQKISQQLKTIVNTVPQTLEKQLELNLGILTMDLGLDTEGRIWILELNSKPSSFDEDDIRMRHLQNLTDYFIYAAKEKNEKGKQ